MNEHLGNILADYRNADFTVRLHLFLQFPELRGRFMAIDQQAPQADSTAGVQGAAAKSKCAWRQGRLMPCFK